MAHNLLHVDQRVEARFGEHHSVPGWVSIQLVVENVVPEDRSLVTGTNARHTQRSFCTPTTLLGIAHRLQGRLPLIDAQLLHRVESGHTHLGLTSTN